MGHLVKIFWLKGEEFENNINHIATVVDRLLTRHRYFYSVRRRVGNRLLPIGNIILKSSNRNNKSIFLLFLLHAFTRISTTSDRNVATASWRAGLMCCILILRMSLSYIIFGHKITRLPL